MVCGGKGKRPQLVVICESGTETERVAAWLCHRPGRLDKLLYVPLPGPEARAAILGAQTARTPLAPGVDLGPLGRSPRVQGFSGADLAALVREAAVLSLKASALRTHAVQAY